MKYSMVFAACCLLFQSVISHASLVAGLMPDRRPEGAPVISEIPDPLQIEGQLLRGIKKPIPESIHRWIKDQGNWYNPFSRPGMLGRYDLRDWHESR